MRSNFCVELQLPILLFFLKNKGSLVVVNRYNNHMPSVVVHPLLVCLLLLEYTINNVFLKPGSILLM